jgi:hypothetical protein
MRVLSSQCVLAYLSLRWESTQSKSIHGYYVTHHHTILSILPSPLLTSYSSECCRSLSNELQLMAELQFTPHYFSVAPSPIRLSVGLCTDTAATTQQTLLIKCGLSKLLEHCITQELDADHTPHNCCLAVQWLADNLHVSVDVQVRA